MESDEAALEIAVRAIELYQVAPNSAPPPERLATQLRGIYTSALSAIDANAPPARDPAGADRISLRLALAAMHWYARVGPGKEAANGAEEFGAQTRDEIGAKGAAIYVDLRKLLTPQARR